MHAVKSCPGPSGDVKILRSGFVFGSCKVENFELISSNEKSYRWNMWSNSRLVCTHLNAFFLLMLDIAIKNIKNVTYWIFEFEGVVFSRHMGG